MTAKDNRFAVRQSAEELIQSSAEAGMAHPERILHLTPREIAAAFVALESERQRRLEDLDLLAWMIGRYVSIGVNAPKRFPRRPNALRTRRQPMTDAQMRRVFINIAERSKQDGSY